MRRASRLLPLLVILAVVLAGSCTRASNDELGADETSVPSAVDRVTSPDTEVPGSATDTAGQDGPALTIDELEEDWAAKRQAVIADLTANIESGEWGLADDGILRGAGGFELDTNACPGDWSNARGVTDDTVRLGHTTAKSGNLAAYGNIGDGMEAYFEYANRRDGIGGRQIELVQKDDAYDAAQTIDRTDELLGSEDVLAISTLGTPNTFAVHDAINDACTPHLFVLSGHPAWGDPFGHPWTVGMQLSYASEAVLWGEWIRANLAEDLPVKVAALVMDNAFGSSYADAMRSFVDRNPDVVSEFVEVLHDPAAASVVDEMSTVASAEPDVFISMTAGSPCLFAIQEAEAAGLSASASALFTPSVCKAVTSYLAPAGSAAEGWYIVGGGVTDITDPSTEGDPFWDFVKSELDLANLDSSIGLYGTGFALYGFANVETLRIADSLPGGLTRTNVMLAARHLALDHPALSDGVTFSTSGASDPYPIEGSGILRFDAAAQQWVADGAAFDADGDTPSCSWELDDTATCR